MSKDEKEYENVLKRKELQDLYTSGEIISLEDLCSLEDVALTIKELGKKMDFYKRYKKKRKQDIDDAIKVLKNQDEFYRAVIITTLKKHKEKSIKFPGSCAISSRNQKSKWKIEDEEEFIAILKEAQKEGENIDDVLEKVTQYNVRKNEANKLLLLWEQSGKLEGFLKKAKNGCDTVVKKEPSKTIVSIKFIEEEEEDEVIDVAIPKKKKDDTALKVDDYDGL